LQGYVGQEVSKAGGEQVEARRGEAGTENHLTRVGSDLTCKERYLSGDTHPGRAQVWVEAT
jgi:hypothetical protein